jgi:thiol:disulfide interchange protein
MGADGLGGALDARKLARFGRQGKWFVRVRHAKLRTDDRSIRDALVLSDFTADWALSCSQNPESCAMLQAAA